MRIVAIHHIKGGVGKTTAAANLAYLAARDGSRVLLWDLDPQGAATFHFRVRPKLAGGARKLVRPGRSLEPQLRASDFHNLDLLPADFSLRNLDLHLDRAKKPRQFLARVCRDLAPDYDLLFVDCPPGFSLLDREYLSRIRHHPGSLSFPPSYHSTPWINFASSCPASRKRGSPKSCLFFPW